MNIKIKSICPFFIVLLLLPFTARARTAPWVGADLDGYPCKGRSQGYGPYDYINSGERSKIPIVERHHFTPEVENLIRGSTGHLTHDLFYTLSAVPNHHKALLTLIRYQFRLNKNLSDKNTNKPLETPVECVFQRAMSFSPNDAATISLFAYYLKEIGQLEKAKGLYEKALIISPNNAKIEYSYSLLLIQLKDYEKAVSHAKKAYKIGNPPQALKNKLQKLGKWQD